MDQKRSMKFDGFSEKALDFLVNVKMNNSKEWFETHRHEYNDYLLKPFQNLVYDLSQYVIDIDPSFEVTPSVNRTISRIYRDTRFSSDKSLYKNNMWITFKKVRKEWRGAPAFFFEIFPESYRFGMGYYSASRESMYIFRKMIDEKPEEFMKAISFYRKQNVFVIEGEMYKKSLAGNKASSFKEWYDRKNLYLVHNSNETKRLFSPLLVEELVNGFKMLEPIYHYLCKVEAKRLENNSWNILR